jgi:hypothetical protein
MPRLIVALGLRLVALVWLLYTRSHLYGFFAYMNPNYSNYVSEPVVWLFVFIQIAICGVLWFFPSTIADKLIPSAARAGEEPIPARLEDWQTIGIICVGLWSLSGAIPDVIYLLTFLYMSGLSGLDSSQKANTIATVIQLGISIWLVFGARALALFLFKIRTGGVSKQASGHD